jgi:hypothetical protein
MTVAVEEKGFISILLMWYTSFAASHPNRHGDLSRMKKSIKVLLCVLVTTCWPSLAFPAEPPKAMMKEVISTYVGNLVTYGELGELVDCLKGNGTKVGWEPVGNGWVLTTHSKDALTHKSYKGRWLFVHDSSADGVNRLYFTRLVFDGQEVSNPGSLLVSPQFMGCWKKERAEAEQARKEDLAKAQKEKLAAEKKQEEDELAAIEQERAQELQAIEAQKRKLESDEKLQKERNKAREEVERQRAALEDQKKAATLKSISGHYENYDGKKVSGTLDIIATDEKSAIFRLRNKMLYASCAIANETAILEYDGSKIVATFGDINSKKRGKRDNDTCGIEIRFREASDAVKESKGFSFYAEIDSQGCRSFCERGGTFMGRYWKASDEPKL